MESAVVTRQAFRGAQRGPVDALVGGMPAGRSRDHTWTVASSAVSIVTAFLASACCIGPLVLALVGVGGGVALTTLDPYRPYLIASTVVVLSTGIYFAYRRPRATADTCDCPAPRSRTAARVLLWLTAVVVVAFVAFPHFAAKVLG